MNRIGNTADHLIRALLPRGGIVVSLVEVYMDESSATESVPFTTVAGYIFRANEARKFNKEWSAALAKKGLPYFRMSERIGLAKKHGLTMDEMDQLARKLIKMLRHRTIKGVGAAVDEEAYQRLFVGRKNMHSAYAFACFGALIQVGRWIENSGYDGEVAYYFESGDEDQSDAQAFLNRLFASPASKQRYRHVAHAFVDKKAVPALQGGDMLAWHTAKLHKTTIEGRPPRKDFLALVRNQDAYLDYTPEQLALMDAELTASGLLPPRLLYDTD